VTRPPRNPRRAYDADGREIRPMTLTPSGAQAGRGFSFRTVKKKERPSGTRALSSRRMSPSPSD
jgi:hypothetical protein